MFQKNRISCLLRSPSGAEILLVGRVICIMSFPVVVEAETRAVAEVVPGVVQSSAKNLSQIERRLYVPSPAMHRRKYRRNSWNFLRKSRKRLVWASCAWKLMSMAVHGHISD